MSNERPKVEQVTTAKVLPPKKSFWSDVLKPFIFDTVLPIVKPLFNEGVRAIGDAIMDAVLNDARPQRQPQQRLTRHITAIHVLRQLRANLSGTIE